MRVDFLPRFQILCSSQLIPLTRKRRTFWNVGALLNRTSRLLLYCLRPFAPSPIGSYGTDLPLLSTNRRANVHFPLLEFQLLK